MTILAPREQHLTLFAYKQHLAKTHSQPEKPVEKQKDNEIPTTFLSFSRPNALWKDHSGMIASALISTRQVVQQAAAPRSHQSNVRAARAA